MIERIAFAFSYAIRNMLRDRQRTAFTLLCVAAGVATVVALRTLGLMLTDALTANAQGFLRGDITVVDRWNDGPSVSIFESDGPSAAHPFTAERMEYLRDWAAERDIDVTFAQNSEMMQAAVVKDDLAGAPAIISSTFIDPAVYPFYDSILAEEPKKVPLNELFTGPNQIVLGRRLADQIEAEVGDQIRIGADENLHTVTGIVPDAAESSFENPMNMMFSFAYLDFAELPQFDLAVSADIAYLKLPPGADIGSIELQLAQEWDSSLFSSGRWRTQTAPDILETNKEIADIISRFVLVLSLVGLVIGGVGIINTMVVAVNRRSMEIAILKTMGLQGRDVSMVFIAEAILSGFVGSLLGILVGIVLSYFARTMGQQAFTVPLPWRIYFEPMVIGIALGMIVTVFFSFLPTTMATRVRPNLVLREGSIPVMRAGFLWSALNLLLLILGFGILVDVIIGTDRIPVDLPAPLTLGIVGTFAVFVVLGLIILLMWVLVWLLGKLPSFREPNLRIAIRGLTSHRMRTALSLLALIIGMTSLSGTLIMARSINILLYTSISQPMGGNVIIMSLSLVKPLIHGRLDGLEGVNGYRDIRFAESMELRSIDGTVNFNRWFDDEDPQSEMRQTRLEMLLGVDVYGNSQRSQLIEGRFLGPEDRGENHIMIPFIDELAARGVGVGSEFVFRRNGRNVTFEVVGVVAPSPDAGLIPFSLGDFAMQVPLNNLPSSEMPFDMIVVDAEQDSVKNVMARVGVIPGLFVFDISIFDSIINRLMTQMAALPLLVAGLALFAATALIATTVALATMERRKQIAMLKAVGVSRWQTLGQLLAENGIIGVAGGIISLLPTVLILGLVPTLSQGLIKLPWPIDLVILMMALSVSVTIGATLVTAWSAAKEKPLEALRYE